MLIRKGNFFRNKISRLEPIFAAMKRDLKDPSIRLDSKQIGLYDCFTEHVINTKGELKNVKNELMAVNGLIYGLDNNDPREYMPLHWNVFIT